MEHLLGVEGQLFMRAVVFGEVELLLFGAAPESWSDYWNDTLYDVVDYLRIRYLHYVISLQNRFTVVEDEVEWTVHRR